MPELTNLIDSRGGPATVLGSRHVRIPTGGRIRPGIKVLTKAARADPRACNIYEAGKSRGDSFDTIEAAIKQAIPDLKSPLVPLNPAYFTVWPDDFTNPEIAHQLLKLYGEDRGDGVRRLYRFPVIFPVDQWQSCMPHEMVCWSASERRFWSEYSSDGKTRLCMQYAPVPKAADGHRSLRMFGGRKPQPRADNNGLCDPEMCPQYQKRECNLSGRFVFYIPGIASADCLELPTNSFYAMSRAIEKFEALSFLRGGRLSGYLNSARATFFVSKQLRAISRIDERGQTVRTDQWIIEIDAPIDITALLDCRDENVALAEGHASAMVLRGEAATPATQIETMRTQQVLDDPGLIRAAASFGQGDVVEHGYTSSSHLNAAAGEPRLQQGGGRPQAVPANLDGPAGPGSNAAPATAKGGDQAAKGRGVARSPVAASGAGTGRDQDDQTALAELEQLWQTANALGIQAREFEQYADAQWGAGWKRNPAGRARAAATLMAAQPAPAELRDKVDSIVRGNGDD